MVLVVTGFDISSSILRSDTSYVFSLMQYVCFYAAIFKRIEVSGPVSLVFTLVELYTHKDGEYGLIVEQEIIGWMNAWING